MSKLTENLKLFEWDTTSEIDLASQFDINKSLNDNWDKIDKEFGDIEDEQTAQDKKIASNTENIQNLQKNDEQQEAEIEKLKEENEELKRENENWKSILPDGQASGESITIKDSADARVKSFEISGNSRQDKREGYNLLKNILTSSSQNGVDFVTNEDGSVTANGTATALAGAVIAKNLNFKAGTYTTKNVLLYVTDVGWFGDFTKTVTKTFDTDFIVEKAFVQVKENEVANNKIFYPMLVKGSYTDETMPKYEPYGAMPSLNYKSDVRSCGDNVNLFDGNGDFEQGFKNFHARQTINAEVGQSIFENIVNNGRCKAYYKIKKGESIVFKIFDDYFAINNAVSANLEGVIQETLSKESATKFTYTAKEDSLLCVTLIKKSTEWFSIEETNQLKDCIMISKYKSASYASFGQGNINVNIARNLVMNKINFPQTFKSPATNFTSIDMSVDNIIKKYRETGFTIKIKAKNVLSKGAFKQVVLGRRVGEVDDWSYRYDLGSFNKRLENDFTIYERFISTSACNNFELIFNSASQAHFIVILEDHAQTTGMDLYGLEVTLGDTTGQDVYNLDEIQTYTIPTQQPFRAIDNYKDNFIKKEDGWYEEHFINSYIFTGNEAIAKQSTELAPNGYFFQTNDVLTKKFKVIDNTSPAKYAINTHFKMVTNGHPYIDESCMSIGQSGTNPYFFLNETYSSVELVKQFFKEQYDKNMPVILYYVLEEPTQIKCTKEQSRILDEIQHAKTYKNVTNIYSTDEVSPNMNVTYYKDLETLLGGGE